MTASCHNANLWRAFAIKDGRGVHPGAKTRRIGVGEGVSANFVRVSWPIPNHGQSKESRATLAKYW
jgi:hypothetical protein